MTVERINHLFADVFAHASSVLRQGWNNYTRLNVQKEKSEVEVGALINTCVSLEAEQDGLLHKVHVTPWFRFNNHVIKHAG